MLADSTRTLDLHSESETILHHILYMTEQYLGNGKKFLITIFNNNILESFHIFMNENNTTKKLTMYIYQ